MGKWARSHQSPIAILSMLLLKIDISVAFEIKPHSIKRYAYPLAYALAGFAKSLRFEIVLERKRIKALSGANVMLGDVNRDYYADNGISSL